MANSLIVDDPVYGPLLVDDLVLIELVNSDAVQRLKHVLQHGITGLIGITRATTRFEHSIGVMFLVQLMGGSLKEQIAGLLHDVSHTAFSHVIDYVFHSHETQHFHDKNKKAFIVTTDLPDILARFGYLWLDFIDEEKYSLVEQPAPRLCADRLDYFFRDGLDLGLATADEVAHAIKHLEVWHGRIIVNDLSVGRWIANTYLEIDKASWANFREVGLYELTAQAIRQGLKMGILNDDDIWSVDHKVWAKLQSAKDPIIIEKINLISPNTRFVWDAYNPDFWVSTKLRTIDPEILYQGELRSLSEMDTKYAEKRLAYLEDNRGKWPMRVILEGDFQPE